MLQCAYGTLRRVVPLPVPVLADPSRASYSQGVLKVELTKAKSGKPNLNMIKVNGKTTCRFVGCAGGIRPAPLLSSAGQGPDESALVDSGLPAMYSFIASASALISSRR